MSSIRETPPSLERLQAKLDYNAKTGWLIWARKAGPAQKGRRAGAVTMAGYRVVTFEGTAYYEHHLAWYLETGTWPLETINHKDRDKSNNKFENLREATRGQNNHNSKVGQVYRRSNKWSAQLTHKGKLVYLGVFSCFGQALKARNAKKRELQPYAEAYRK